MRPNAPAAGALEGLYYTSFGPALNRSVLFLVERRKKIWHHAGMKVEELVRRNRSYRRFKECEAVSRDFLASLVGLARLSASGANLQPLRYVLSCEPEKNALVFPHLKWAGYLKDWRGPAEGERPAAYIIVLADLSVSGNPGVDPGIAAQSILLGAVEAGLGGCIISSIDRQGLAAALDIPPGYSIQLAIALGRPAETVILEEIGPGGDVKYWRDPQGAHHVPKRKLEDLILDV